jgi:transcriptional regulator with XRE-family HTH domain
MRILLTLAKGAEMVRAFDLSIRGTGEVLRKLRTAACMSQDDLAGKVGINKGDLSRYENNEVGVPYYRLIEIAAVLGISPKELLNKLLAYAEEHNLLTS